MSETAFKSAAAAEAAFYQAFSGRDAVGMGQVWGDENIICIHPGAPMLRGRKAVMQSWVRILAASEMPGMQIEIIQRWSNADTAVHVVREILTPGQSEQPVIVQATNVYQHGPDGWKMVSHHGSPAFLTETRETAPRPVSRTLQ